MQWSGLLARLVVLGIALSTVGSIATLATSGLLTDPGTGSSSAVVLALVAVVLLALGAVAVRSTGATGTTYW